MLSEDAKKTIDALSKAELRQEINKKNRSIFQGDKYAYLQTRLAEMEEAEETARRQEDVVHRRKELSFNRLSVWIAILASILMFLVGGGWYQEIQKNKRAKIEANERLLAEYLEPISTRLTDNESIFKDLSSDKYAEPNWGILESFLIKIRRDGVSKHALMRNRIDTLVRNNETIVTLLTKYAAHIKTDSLRVEAEKFRDHAILYSDRWRSLIEIYDAGGTFDTNAPVFPAGFPDAVQAEISDRRSGP